MNFVKYNEKNHIEIQPAALVLSDLDQADRLEMHTLDGALVLLKDDMTDLEQLMATASLVKLAHAMMQDMSTRHHEDELDDNGACIYGSADGGIIVSVGGHKLFTLAPDTVDEFGACGITPEMLADLLLDLMEYEDED